MKRRVKKKMPTQTFNVYIPDEEYETFIGLKKQITEEIKQLVKEKIQGC